MWDCESDSIDLGISNEVSIEESLDLEVSKEYTHEVNGQVTVGITASFKGGLPFGIASTGLPLTQFFSDPF